MLTRSPRSEIEHSMYIVNVDLWNEDGTQEVNLVRHSGSTPSISSTTPTSFAQVQNSMAHPQILPAQDQTGGHVAFQNPPSVNPFAMGNHMAPAQSPQGSSAWLLARQGRSS